MVKVADVKLKWVKSPSSGVAKVDVDVTINGTLTKTELGPEVESFMVEVAASGSVQFKVITFDNEGLQSTSEVYSFTLGDLEAPLPATGLGHEVVAIRELTTAP